MNQSPDKFCQDCGAELTKDAQFCLNCGRRLVNQVTSSPAPSIHPLPEKLKQPATPKQRQSAWINVIAAIMVFVGGFIFWQITLRDESNGGISGFFNNLFSGCSISNERGILSTRLQDFRPGVRPQSVDHFGPGETPLVVVFGHGGELVTVRIINLVTNEAVRSYNTETHLIPEGLNATWQYPDLPAGSYRVTFSVGGVSTDSLVFSVSR